MRQQREGRVAGGTGAATGASSGAARGVPSGAALGSAIGSAIGMAVLFVALACGLALGAPEVPGAASGLPDFRTSWDFQHPDSSEARFRRLLPLAMAAGDDDYRAQLLTQIARAQGLQQRYEAAHATLDGVISLLNPERSQARVRYLLERGRVFNSSGRGTDARPFFAQAWSVARAAGLDGLAVDAAHMVAIVEVPDSALVWNHRAMALAESSSDPGARGWLGPLYNNLGWTHHDQGDYMQALELFEKGLAWRREQGQARETRIAEWAVARTLRSLGRYEEALSRQQTLEREWEATGEPDGYVFEEIGECLVALGRADEAKKPFTRAYELLWLDPWMRQNERERLEKIRSRAGCCGGR